MVIKKQVHPKFDPAFVVLMSPTNSEKDSLLGQTVLPPELGQILGRLVFYDHPLSYCDHHDRHFAPPRTTKLVHVTTSLNDDR